MTPLTLPHIDIYPLIYEPFDRFSAVRGVPDFPVEIPPLESGFEIHNPLDHALRAVRSHDNVLPSLTEERLAEIAPMRIARRMMPNLQDIPAIHKYRNSHPHYSSVDVDAEMTKFGIPLHSGQVLFHGGVFPRLLDGTPMNSFQVPKVLSTTFCAQVAATHSGYHSPKDVWILRVAPRSTTRAIVLGIKGQNLGHEMEVLLETGAQLILRKVHADGEYTHFEVDLI